MKDRLSTEPQPHHSHPKHWIFMGRNKIHCSMYETKHHVELYSLEVDNNNNRCQNLPTLFNSSVIFLARGVRTSLLPK